MHPIRFRRYFGVFFLFSVVACSSKDRPVPQKGVVTLDGKPLAGYTVTFASTQDMRPAWGTTDEEGRFELTTYNPGDGALRGEYKVVLTSPTAFGPQKGGPKLPDAKSSQKVRPIHVNYQSVQKTPLTRVVPAPEGEIVLQLNKSGS